MIEINMLKKVSFKGYTLIEGFPSSGLVGPISIGYLISKLGLEYAGFISSDEFPPIVSIHQGVPLPPIRIYYSEKYKIVTIFAEINPIAEKSLYDVLDSVYKFIKDNGIEQIISISEIPTKEETNKVYAIASNQRMKEMAKNSNMEEIVDGVAAGLSALLIARATIDNLSDINILVPIVPGGAVDPKYAEIALKSISKLLRIEIDLTELEAEAKAVESKTKNLIKKRKENNNPFDDSQSMYV
ncbi:MAG: PAC2 family protein [Candidatus Micrarchaeaceae archaeon]